MFIQKKMFALILSVQCFNVHVLICSIAPSSPGCVAEVHLDPLLGKFLDAQKFENLVVWF